MKIVKVYFVALFATTMVISPSCSRRKVLGDFDSQKWISDKGGCSGTRMKMKNDLLLIKYKLRGLKYSEITQVLGRPDTEELYERNQKFYTYYLQKGPDCPQVDSLKSIKVQIRFTAVGISKEVQFLGLE